MLTRSRALALRLCAVTFFGLPVVCVGQSAPAPVGPPAPTRDSVCGAGLLPKCPSVTVAAPPRLSPRLGFYGALAAADLVSTEMFRSRGVQEANPLMRHRGMRLALEAGTAYGSAKLDQLAARKGKTKGLWLCRAAITIGTAYIVKHNLDAYRAAGAGRPSTK